jgi:head-tail adaptor
MRAGNLIHRINFYDRVSERSASGSFIDTYPEITISTRGEVQYRGSNKLLSNEEISYTNSVILTVRYRSEISQTMRVQIDGTSDLYFIDGIPEIIGRKHALRLNLEKLNDGLSLVTVDPVTDLQITFDTDRNLITWTNNADGDGVMIYRSIDGNEYSRIAKTGKETETYDDTEIESLTRYFYKIKAYKYYDYSIFTDVEIITTGEIT